MGRAIYKSGKQQNNLLFFLFLFPAAFAFLMVIVIPFFMGVYYSFTNWNAITGTEVKWVGIQNYRAVMSDITFLNSFLVTVAYAILNIIVLNVCAFFMALLVTSKLKFKGIYRAGFFLPNLIGGLILGYIWQFIFNNAIPAFGGMINFSWLKEHQFLADRYLALLAIVIVGTWQYAGYIMMIYVAAIQGIPDTLLEAAQIDGANYRQRLRHIVFPLVAPAFTVSMFLTLVNSFKQFDVNFALTAGGPSGMFMGKAIMTNEFLALNIYQTAFSFRQLAQGQAKAVIFFIVITVISLIQVWVNKKREIEM
ncbi:MAG: sugar ABC transporter permease [Treponema sp.]|jgi:raffinose/stachyose/melibiose transport system permease protein|nr:sugar ABC transporter permease [Treponema sp.]